MAKGIEPTLAELMPRYRAPNGNWFAATRQAWIAEMLAIYGFINREHIMRKFGVSVPQASIDLRAFQDSNPNACRYNKTAKRYEAVQ